MKNIVTIMGMISLLLFSACKKNDEILPEGAFEISSGWAQASYAYYNDSTSLAMYVGVSSLNETGGMITSWKFVFKDGGTEVLEINEKNYASYVPYIVANGIVLDPGRLPVIPANQKAGFRFEQGQYFNACSPGGARYDAYFICHGDVLNGKIPDNMDITVTINDESSHAHTYTRNVRASYIIF